MTKVFLALAIFCGILISSQHFGVKAGLNISSLSEDESISEQKTKMGFNAGIFMNTALGEKFSIQPELLYSQMGDKSTVIRKSTIDGTTIMYKTVGSTNLDYLTLPIMLQYRTTSSLYFEAGPEFGLLLNGNLEGENTFTTSTGNSTVTTTEYGSSNIKNYINTFNIGIGLGIGYYVTQNLGVSARYNVGLTKVGVGFFNESKNNVFQVGLFYRFK